MTKKEIDKVLTTVKKRFPHADKGVVENEVRIAVAQATHNIRLAARKYAQELVDKVLKAKENGNH